MNNSKRLLSASAIALVLSGGCTALLSYTMARHAVSAHEQRTSYAEPARAIPAGKPLEAADLRMMDWPASSPMVGALLRVDDAIGRTTLYPLTPGQPVLEHDLSARGAGPGLAGRIPDGMRAIALRSDEVVGVGGFLSPGLHVDMLVTFRAQGATDAVTATALQDAEVLAVGQQSEPDPQGKPTMATVVTLLLTPQQAQRALLASTQGTVHFVLRNSADKNSSKSDPTTLGDLGGNVARPQPMPMLSGLLPLPIQTQARPKAARPAHAAETSSAVETIVNTTSEKKGQ